MKTAAQRRGNSLAPRIPKTCAAETDTRDRSELGSILTGGTPVVRPLGRKKHALGDLLKRITLANRHREIATGRSVGREIS
jgi:antitoxin component of MazEF toxin-antitoxin module